MPVLSRGIVNLPPSACQRQSADAGMTYAWSISSLFWVLLPQSSLQKAEQRAEHLVLVGYLPHIQGSVYKRKEGRKESMWSIS